MAQGVVIRFKADSTEYDARLKRSIEQMKQMENEAKKLNGTVDRTDESYIKFVQSLGSMETKANSAKGKINEMTQAFTELSLQYNRLTKEEKASPFGNALASSLDQLKSRIKGAKSELAGIEGQLTGIGDVFKQVGSKMGIPMEMFTKLGPVVAAAGAAIKVATDVFRQNEELMDEWGQTTEAAGTVYQGFLNALNTGDLGGFLRNIGNIISKSREAYDALDQLGTFNAFNQIQIEGARTNFNEAMANYREGRGTKEDVKAAADRLKNEMQSRQDKEQAAYIAAIKELAASRGVDEEMLQKALSGTYGDYETLKNTPLTRHEEQIWNGNMFGKTTTTKVTWSADTMEQKLGEALRKISDDELARIQALGAQAQRTATEIAQVDKQTVRLLGKSSGGGGASAVAPTAATDAATMTYADDSIKAQEVKVAELTKLWKEASAELRDGYYAQLQKAKAELEEMTKGPLTELKGQMSFAVEPVKIKIDTSNLKLAKNDAQGMRDAFSAAASAVATVGGALQQIEDPAAKVAGIIAAAIAQVAITFASSLKGTMGPWDWIAAALSGTATMISTIAAIKSATAGSYAYGGKIPGNSFSGDNMRGILPNGDLIGLDAGEIILNRAQQGVVAGAMQGNPMNDLNLGLEVEGTKMLILLNNTNRSLGGSRNFYSERH